ncbi:MAG: hypothetical protein LHW51_08095, partial [Candidatus Cloacimonetes bacterium]|nr:hypothetical protein [Candidatus Cloacimonadota bacterium]
MFSLIRKRNEQIVDFDQSKITRAIEKAASASGEFGFEMAEKLCLRVINLALQTITEDI